MWVCERERELRSSEVMCVMVGEAGTIFVQSDAALV